MASNTRDPWAGLFEGLLAITFVALRFLVAFVVIPVALASGIALLRLQELVLDGGLVRLATAAGIEVDTNSLPIRLAATVLFYGMLFLGLYFLFLAGTHLSTLILLMCVSAVFGLGMTALAGFSANRGSDTLASLRFWRD